jgi:hypothetical protein
MTEELVGEMRSLLGRQQELVERAEGIKRVVTAAVLIGLSVVTPVIFVTTGLFR